MNYPNKETIVTNLTAAAELAGNAADDNHPGDFAAAMSAAIENAGSLLQWQHENGYLYQKSSLGSGV